MEIRKATETDFPVIESVIRNFPEKLMQDHLPRPEEFFVAQESGTIIGCCALEVYSQRLAEVRSLAVLPEHQGKGIARQLVEKCLEEAKALNIYEVLAISGANSLFEKYGFGTFKNEKYALIKILK
jgi:amino-acid N-acetyltransferase